MTILFMRIKSQVKIEEKNSKTLNLSREEKNPKIISTKQIEEKELAKIVNETKLLFYDVNIIYDKEMISDNDAFVKFFKNNTINSEPKEKLSLENDNDNYFLIIGKNDEEVNSIEMKNKNKIEEMLNTFKSLDYKFDTKGIVSEI